jgi:amidophosphoribosyltransferase
MCGFVGLIGASRAAPVLHLGLQAIQHRGQDAAGIATSDGGRFHLHKDLGMVTQALPASVVEGMGGGAGIAHVRYPTIGLGTREDAQPFYTRHPGILMAHNGNVTNLEELDRDLTARGFRVQSSCDCEPILLVLADELTRLRSAGHTLDDLAIATRRVMERVRGGYAAVAVLEVDGRDTLVAMRDSHGIRPAVYGRLPSGAWMVASESVALDVVGATVVGHVPSGAMVVLRGGEEPIVRELLPRGPRHCVFERLYFARPDSVTEEGRINAVRWQLGRRLAEEWLRKGLTADVVVAVPDTSRPAATAVAEALGIPDREGFIKNRYSGRTFIMPDQATRDAALRLKLNPMREVFEGKRVLMIDDSIVRGSTMRRIVRMIRQLDPREVHLGIFAPPVLHPCFYGIDMPSKGELVAAQHAPELLEVELARALGVDSLTYLSLGGLRDVAGASICDACFSGDYVVPVSSAEQSLILRSNQARASGSDAEPAP